MRRWLTWFVLAAFLPHALGCTSRRVIQVEASSPKQRSSEFDSKTGWSIVGYTTTDGVYHPYVGRAHLDHEGQIQFTPGYATRPTEKEVGVRFALPREQVQQLMVEELNDVGKFGKVVFISLGVLVAIGIIGLVILTATWDDPDPTRSSCPLLYSFDGERFVLDGEPYGGAIARSLERADWCELSSLRPSAGRYQLLLRNPADETDYTNSLHLQVVDHEPGSRVVRDAAGGMHAFRSVAPLVSARDARGQDVARQLLHADHDEWFSNLDAITAADAAPPLREPIEIEFDRPTGTDTAWLLGRVRSSSWSGRLLRNFVEMYGGAAKFSAAVDGDAARREQLLGWSAREELLSLQIEVWEGDRWVARGRLAGGSPWVEEDQAVRLDLTGSGGDRVRVRVQPPTSLWVLDCFEIAWDEAPVQVQTFEPLAAVDANGTDVRAALRADDGEALVFPHRDDHALISFETPAPRPDSDRTVFARTSGYYELHTEDGAPVDPMTMAHLFGPGEIVRWSLAHYAALESDRALRAPNR